ncbi:site-specific integrase [Rhizobium ruizarguesonis]|uniref:site-specific integrase n=1 Tax=Rhizobium ruizarguesonis TaxID=2081791 RepID=UPI00102FABA6|nr:site-specific integrase [Rhizobium ruizarguesonis]TBE77262.1 site-specific integrase [Rhizobium ruizarguesonis]
MSFDRLPRGRTLAVTSIIDTGDSLVNFLSWANVHEIPLGKAVYDDILIYQDDMQSGQWSKAGVPLNGRTINARGSAACSYLMWTSHIGAGEAFVPTLTAATVKVRNGNTYKKTVRVGLKKAKRSQIERVGLPRETWVDDWLAQVVRRRGKSKMLACRLIVDVGPRIAEVCGACVECWPSKEAIAEAKRYGERHVDMALEYTKGNVPRTVVIDVDFAEMVRNWIDEERPKLVDAFVRRTKRSTPRTLFLSDAPGYEGTPLLKSRLYECFRLAVPGYTGRWYPHKGRHYFTCMYLLKRVESSAALHGKTIAEMPADWVHGQVASHWDTASELLGHSDPATTKIYTKWIVTIHQGYDASEGWMAEFDEEADA